MRFARTYAAAILLALLSAALYLAPVIPVALLGGIVITQTACPESKTLGAIAHRVVREIDVALPILESNNIDTAILLRARDLAAKAETAFNNSDTAKGAALVGQLITVFESELTAQINKISDKTVRNIVLVGLYLVNSRLHDLSDKLGETAGNVGMAANDPSAQVIANFKAKKKWRCRSSQTGRYASMDYCRAHPDVSTVETY